MHPDAGEVGWQGSQERRATLCGRLGEALRSGAYAGFREGLPTLVNIAEVSD